jgi:hypothetical protein
MQFLRQSTAVDIAIGPFLDATDAVTAESGLTISQADVRLKKNNGAWAQVNDATSATHEENGWYEKELDATDTNTVGILIIAVHESGALPVWHQFYVLEEAVFDALFAASALGYVANAPVNVAQFGGSNGTFSSGRPEVNTTHAAGTAWNSGAIGATTLASDTLTAAKVASDVGTEIGTAVWATAARSLTVLDEDSTTLDLDATIRAAIGLASANLDTQIGDLPTNSELATSQASADDATLSAIAGLDTKLDTIDNFLDTEIADIRRAIGPATTTIATLASQTSFTLTAGSADDDAYVGWGCLVVDASSAVQVALGVISAYTGSTKTVTLREDPGIFTMATSDLVILLPGKLTDGVNVTLIEGVDATDQLDAHAAAGLDAAGVRAALGMSSANLDTQLAALPTAAENADAVWDESTTGHTTSGTFGEQLKTDVDAILVDTGTTLDGRIPAALVSGRMDASVGAMAANVMTAAAAASDLTTELQSGLATAAELAKVPKSDSNVTWNATALASINTQADTALADYDGPTNAEMEARTIAAANYATAANLATVDTVVDGIKVTTDKLDDTLEDQGAGTYGFTEAALQEAPSAGGGTDWDVDERTAIRSILGIPASGSTPDDPSAGILDTIRDAVATRASQTSVDDLPTNGELATALAAADDAVLAAIAALNNISVANVLAATVEGSTTLVQTLRLLNAALGGKASGLATTTAVYRDIGDTKARITATVDADGNRSAVTLDLT